jgi:hypothetical protein
VFDTENGVIRINTYEFASSVFSNHEQISGKAFVFSSAQSGVNGARDRIVFATDAVDFIRADNQAPKFFEEIHVLGAEAQAQFGFLVFDFRCIHGFCGFRIGMRLDICGELFHGRD